MTLTEAQQKLELWQAALDATAEGQSYQMGRLQLTRVDVDKCLKMVKYYEGIVSRLQSGRKPGARVLRVIPRDF
jgi:hypothetical protein